MTESEVYRDILMVGGLSHIAWADGTLHQEEAGFFRELIDHLHLESIDGQRIWRLVVCPMPLDQLDWSRFETVDRHQLLKFAYALALADGGASDEEMNRIRELATALDISWKEAVEIIDYKIAW
jgi:tellurite resistance protein